MKKCGPFCGTHCDGTTQLRNDSHWFEFIYYIVEMAIGWKKKSAMGNNGKPA